MPKKSSTARVRQSPAKKNTLTLPEISAIESRILGDILHESHAEIYVFDASTFKFIYVNKGALENLGYSMEEMHQLTPSFLKREFTVASFEKLVGTLRKHEKERLYFEATHTRKNGSEYPVEANLQLANIDGKKLFISIIHDVSDKKQMDETIHILHRAIESGGDGVIITDAKNDGNPVVYVNGEFLKLSGYGSAEVYSMQLSDLFGSEDKEIAKVLNRSLKHKIPFRGELLCKKKDGSTFWNFLTLTPIFDESGAIHNFILFNRDVSLQKTAVMELGKSYYNLQLLDRLGTAAFNNADFEELSQLIVTIFSEFITPVSCRLYKYDKQMNFLQHIRLHMKDKMAAYIKKSFDGRVESLIPNLTEGSIYMEAMTEKKIVYIENDTGIESMLKEMMKGKKEIDFFKKMFADLFIKSYGIIPLICNNESIGMITFASDRVMNEKDKESIERFCTYIASVFSMEIEKQKSMQYRLQSLSSQMNPHFIFNAINSIQYFIFDENKENIFGYLSNLSSLFRQALYNSERTYITLEEESDFLRHYLELECKRMKGKLSYKIIIDKKIDVAGVLIPPMLLQPYIENAIHHGITPKTGTGKIQAEFMRMDNYHMVCRITDDGIGIQKSQEIKAGFRKTPHKSLGMNIAKTRMELLNSLSNNAYSVHVKSNEKTSGTVITISFPFISY